MSTGRSANSFDVLKVELSTESEGPDYFTLGEYRVIDRASGEIVARFLWSLDEPYLTNKFYSGPEGVIVTDDGAEAVAFNADGSEERVLLPGGGPIVVDGVPIEDATDMAALLAERGGQWMHYLHRRLGVTAGAAAIARAAASLLDHEDARVRTEALRFYYFVPDATGIERVFEIADTRRELLDDALFTHILKQRLRTAADEGTFALGRREGLGAFIDELLA